MRKTHLSAEQLNRKVIRLGGGLFALISLLVSMQPGVCGPVQKSEEGFSQIFNGKDLRGWDGDPRFWSVKDGVIRGETTSEHGLTKNHSYLIWRGGTLEDFEIRLKFRILTGNSGVQVRSKDLGNWVVSGYQAEVVPGGDAIGSFYEVKGRGRLTLAGQKIVIDEKGEKQFVGTFGDPDVLRALYKEKDWNELTIVARGNDILQKLNGVTMSEIVDNQKDKRALSGILALQLHAGPPMVVEFKDIRLKRLEGAKVVSLFNGKDLTGWEVKSDGFFTGHGKVEVVDGEISIEAGAPMSGIGWTGKFPKENYEFSLEGKRVTGYDFWAGVTFPVGDSYVTLILGGWGGYVVGLSNVDDMNASENQTSMGREFKMNQWYRVRVRVTKDRIRVWIDDEQIIDIERKGHTFSVWPEQEPIRPFGISTYETGSRLRNITLRLLDDKK